MTSAVFPAGSRTAVRRGLRDDVYDRILDLLLSGRAEPGTRLGIDAIARELDVSPTPVREALVQLERTGLVTREALKGYRVAPPLTAEQIAELFDARLILEAGAMELAVRAGGSLAEDLAEAHRVHGVLAERILSGDDPVPVPLLQEYFEADTAFHEVVRRTAGNHFLSEMSASLGTHLHRMRQTLSHGATDVAQAVSEHAAIVAAVESGDPDAAVAAMRDHIGRVRARAIADA